MRGRVWLETCLDCFFSLSLVDGEWMDGYNMPSSCGFVPFVPHPPFRSIDRHFRCCIYSFLIFLFALPPLFLFSLAPCPEVPPLLHPTTPFARKCRLRMLLVVVIPQPSQPRLSFSSLVVYINIKKFMRDLSLMRYASKRSFVLFFCPSMLRVLDGWRRVVRLLHEAWLPPPPPSW